MTLVPRILVLGVVLPLTGVCASVVIAGSLFRRSLLQDVDRRLLAQAAVESVSLFDGPEGRPHLHLPRSPLAHEVEAFAPQTALIDPSGVVLTSAPQGPTLSPVPRATQAGQVQLSAPTLDTRALTLGVPRPGEGLYTLYLVASLAPVEATMAAFYRALGGTLAAIALALTAILFVQARRLARRVTELGRFVPLIREGALPPSEPPEGADELTALGVVLGEAARFHHAQHLSQERFLANAAHQLRTPLAVLRTELDLALRRPRGPEELVDALEHARTEAQRLTLLARKLLDFESLRSQQLELSQVPVRELVREVVERQGPAASIRKVTLEAQGDAAALRCDKVLVAQALENLVDNALRFAPEGSQVRVTTERADGRCRLLVHDDGPGIPEAEQGHVFEPFFRGPSPGAQTGLGLAFVADVARQHGGRALLVPCARGTTVGLELPCEAP